MTLVLLAKILLVAAVALCSVVDWPALVDRMRSRAERRRKIHTLALYPDYKDSEPEWPSSSAQES